MWFMQVCISPSREGQIQDRDCDCSTKASRLVSIPISHTDIQVRCADASRFAICGDTE